MFNNVTPMLEMEVLIEEVVFLRADILREDFFYSVV